VTLLQDEHAEVLKASIAVGAVSLSAEMKHVSKLTVASARIAAAARFIASCSPGGANVRPHLTHRLFGLYESSRETAS